MNVVFIIPTGLGCAIGGHAGDATPALQMIAGICDTVVTHPNVVNASDINEMPPNALYVEGSMLDRFLRGEVGLKRVRSNRILVVVNAPACPETINAVSAARATLGVDARIVELETPLAMEGRFDSAGMATGEASGYCALVDQVKGMDFDALAIATPITIAPGVAARYFREGGVNPWGGIEAKVSREIAEALNKPVAHAPVECENTKADNDLFELPYTTVVDPRMAAEAVSIAYLHCVLKGLHRAPSIDGCDLVYSDIDALITPVGCIGPPHHACFDAGTPVIGVESNTTVLSERDDRIIYVNNYLEAAGVLCAMRAGVTLESVQHLTMTTVLQRQEGN